MSELQRDTLFSTPREGVKSSFAFDSEVAAVFDDMIGRSVPLYREIQRATALLAARIVPEGGTICDLGCSTGTTLLLLARELEGRRARLIGVDNSPAMLEACREKLDRGGIAPVELVFADLRTYTPPESSLLVVNYTLQFLPPAERGTVLGRLARSLAPDGALLMSEKIHHADPRMQQLLHELHLDFKRQHGYSELEIRQKRDAIENVLVPLTLEENVSLLRAAGFGSAEVLASSLNFVTIVAAR